HVVSNDVGQYRIRHLAANVKQAAPRRRCEPLVAGCRIGIHTQIAHVHIQNTECLSAVDETQSAFRMREFRYLLHRRDRSRYRVAMCDADGSCSRSDSCGTVVQNILRALRWWSDGRIFDGCAIAFRIQEPGLTVAVVL